MKKRSNRDKLINLKTTQPDNKYLNLQFSNQNYNVIWNPIEFDLTNNQSLINKSYDYYISLDKFKMSKQWIPIGDFHSFDIEGQDTPYKVNMKWYKYNVNTQTVVGGGPYYQFNGFVKWPQYYAGQNLIDDQLNIIQDGLLSYGVSTRRYTLPQYLYNGTDPPTYSKYMYSVNQFIIGFNYLMIELIYQFFNIGGADGADWQDNFIPIGDDVQDCLITLDYQGSGFNLFIFKEFFRGNRYNISGGGVDPNIGIINFMQLEFNEPLQQLLNGFCYGINRTTHVSELANNQTNAVNQYMFIFRGPLSAQNFVQVFNPLNDVEVSGYSFSEYKNSLDSWNGITSLIIKLEKTYAVRADENQLESETLNPKTKLTQKNNVLAEIFLDNDQNNSCVLYYEPKKPIYVDMTSDQEMRNCKISVWFKDTFGVERQALTCFNEGCTMTLKFTKKQLANNYFRSDKPI